MSRAAGFMLALIFILTLPISAGYLSGGRAGLSYATSESMEPELMTGDGFIVLPGLDAQLGDVVVYRPAFLEASRVVHRVVAVTERGLVTKGDNSGSSDQEAGEPAVTRDRVIGRVLTWNGRLVRIPGVGPASERLRGLLPAQIRAVMLFLLALGIGMLAWDAFTLRRNRSSSTRWRVGHLYAAAAVFTVSMLVTATILGSGVESVRFLASERPGPLPNHVKAGEPGVVTITIRNAGMIPVYHFSSAMGDLRVQEAPSTVPVRSSVDLKIAVPARAPGWYWAHVQVYHYPALLPRPVAEWLHARSPYLAIFASAGAAGAVLWAFSMFIATWVPLSARRQTMLTIRMRRLFRRMTMGRRML